MKIIKRREYHETKTYSIFFEYADMSGAGFSFPCNEQGEIDETKLNPCAVENLKASQAGEITYRDGPRNQDGDFIGETKEVTRQIHNKRIHTYTNRHITPSVGECNHCGEHVELHGFTNTCSCGTDYNMSGQELASRSQWGEETGESVDDILSVDSGYDYDY